MMSKLLIFGSRNFNSSMNEIKEYLDYSLIFFDFTNKSYLIDSTIAAIIIDSYILNKDILNIINKINNKPILLLETLQINQRCKYDEKILLPISFFDLRTKIKKITTSFKFLINSSLKIKSYVLDKNEKKLIKKENFIFITEKEVMMIELLFNEKKPLTKDYILKKIWNYSDKADTHTVETHIYRLRKKIFNKFNDDKFILNFEKGYII